jgi:hypothetical protein
MTINTGDPPKIQWTEVISISQDNWFSGNVNVPPEFYVDKIENFLNDFEKTEFGQNVLNRIKNKYTDSCLEISVNDFLRSMLFVDGNITLDVRDDKSTAFINLDNCEPMLFPFERGVLHELIHASDPRIKIGEDNQDKCHTLLVEEFAVSETDKYARTYANEFGTRGTYGNAIVSSEPNELLGEQQGDPLCFLEENPHLKEKILGLVETVKSDIEICTYETHNFQGLQLPVSSSNKSIQEFQKRK